MTINKMKNIEILSLVKLSADTSKDLASELVHYAFINEVDTKVNLFLFFIKIMDKCPL